MDILAGMHKEIPQRDSMKIHKQQNQKLIARPERQFNWPSKKIIQLPKWRETIGANKP